MKTMRKKLLIILITFTALIFSSACNSGASNQVGLLYVPLDNRPSNYQDVIKLAELTDQSLIYPSLEQLASPETLNQWLTKRFSKAEAYLLSLDQMIYGGLVESRKHNTDSQELNRNLDKLKGIKNKETPVYAFISIMRTPVMNTPNTMPDYYAKHGAQIYKYGELMDKMENGKATLEEEKKYNELAATIPKQYLNDFVTRRDKNHYITQEILKLVKNGYIDYLIISKDDTSAYGFTRMEAEKLEKLVEEYDIARQVMFFTGTDECGMVLLTAMESMRNNNAPRVYVDYAQPAGADMILPYEDVPLAENIDRHIKAAGAIETTEINNADLVLAVHNRAQEDSAPDQNLYQREFISRIQSYTAAGQPVMIADIKHPNGGDNDFMEALNKTIDLSKLAGYSGWNTAGNSLGLVLSQGIVYHINKDKDIPGFPETQRDILLNRLIKDWGYQAVVRPAVKEQVPPDQRTLFTDGDLEKQITAKIQNQLNEFADTQLKEDFGEIAITNVDLPWHRLFDIDFDV